MCLSFFSFPKQVYRDFLTSLIFNTPDKKSDLNMLFNIKNIPAQEQQAHLDSTDETLTCGLDWKRRGKISFLSLSLALCRTQSLPKDCYKSKITLQVWDFRLFLKSVICCNLRLYLPAKTCTMALDIMATLIAFEIRTGPLHS